MISILYQILTLSVQCIGRIWFPRFRSSDIPQLTILVWGKSYYLYSSIGWKTRDVRVSFHLLWCILHGYPKDISRGSILLVKSPLNPNFWTPFPFYSGHDNPFPVTGTGMENCIPKFWERESKKYTQLLETGTGMKNSFPSFGNGNRRPVFPKMVRNGNSRSTLA